MTPEFFQTDAGRSESKRPRQKNDCTVRALSLAVGIPYDRAHDELALAGRKYGSRFVFDANSYDGAILRWRSFQAVKGTRRMTPGRFCAEHPTGRWIVKTAKHVFAVVGGVILDETFPRLDRCVYGAWEVVEK
jgi:hypothetical protein